MRKPAKRASAKSSEKLLSTRGGKHGKQRAPRSDGYEDIYSVSQNDARDIYSSSDHSPAGRNQRHKKKIKSRRDTIKRILLSSFLIFICTCCLVVGTFACYVILFVDDSFDFDLNNLKLEYTSIIYAQDNDEEPYYELSRIHGRENRIWVDYTDFSPYLVDSIVAVEDKRFYDHDGVDWKRTLSAFVNMFFNISDSSYGGSTLTQQLVKNLTGDKDRTSLRKIQEIMRSRYVEDNYPKATIMECYANTVHFGNGCDGIEVASQFYFGKSAKELTLLECASMAATIQTPASKNPLTGPESNKSRRETVLKLMLEQELIRQEEYDEAMSQELIVIASSNSSKAPTTNTSSSINSYFVDTVIEQIIADLMQQKGYTYTYAENIVITGGLKVYSTYNKNVQTALDETYANSKNFLKSGKGSEQPQSAIMVMDYDGHVVGVVGGRGEKTNNRAYNRATQAKRQPGSSIKPLASYSAALEHNMITYSHKILDAPITLNNGTKYPKNSYSNSKVYIHKALERSLNTVAVRLITNLTPQKSFEFITQRYHISTLVESQKLDNGKTATDITLSSMALGGVTHGVTVRDMCAAYACYGNLGKYWEPTTYTKVEDSFGKTLLEQQKKGEVAIGEDTAFIMNKMMQNVVQGSQGTGKSGKIGNWPLFGKTGTTDDNKDRWFVGGSPYYVAASWYGFDTPKPLTGMSTNPALKVWRATMAKIHEDLELKDYPETDKVTYRYYCTSSGELATNHCSGKALGWYKTSYLPVCSTHGGTLLNEVSKPKPVGPTPVTDAPSPSSKPEPSTNSSSLPSSSSAPSSSSTPSSSSAPVSSSLVSSTPTESRRPQSSSSAQSPSSDDT